MSRREMLDAVVVGGGVVGATAALALAREGRRVALVDARPPECWHADAPDLRVYAFAPDSAALLERLGVWREVQAARVQPYRRMRVWDAAGGGELGFDADALARPQLGWIVENRLLVDRLWAALDRAQVRVECPDRVEGLDQDEASAELTLASGSRLRARLVLAVDGADSALRALAGIDAPAHDYGQRGVVAFVHTERPHEATCWQRFLPTGPLALLPFGESGGRSRSSIVWTLPDAEAERVLALEDVAFGRELTDASAARLGDVQAASPRAGFALRRQLAGAMQQGRVLVLGDAAHVVHPLAGQGVNLGLRDVSALLDTLAGVPAGEDIGRPSLLARWARRRRSENALAAYAMDGINRVYSNDAPLLVATRGRLLGLAGALPPVAHALWRRASGG